MTKQVSRRELLRGAAAALPGIAAASLFKPALASAPAWTLPPKNGVKVVENPG